jgi:hypothetical protein
MWHDSQMNIFNGCRSEWESGRNRANQKEHRISFEEAVMVFYDEGVQLYKNGGLPYANVPGCGRAVRSPPGGTDPGMRIALDRPC